MAIGPRPPEPSADFSDSRRFAILKASDAKSIADGIVFRIRMELLVGTVMSHSTSQNTNRRGRVVKFSKRIGSSGWIRTSNPPVNSRMLCR